MPRPADGIFRSTVFPGLWLDPAALLRWRPGPRSGRRASEGLNVTGACRFRIPSEHRRRELDSSILAIVAIDAREFRSRSIRQSASHRPQRPSPRLPEVPPRRLPRRARVDPDRRGPRARRAGAADPPHRPGSRPARDAQRSSVRGSRGREAPRLARAGRHPARGFLPQGPPRRHHPLLPRPPPGRKGDRVPSPAGASPSAAPGSTS